MNERKEANREESQQPEKKPYAQPELIKHGNVESQTQQQTGPSGPIREDI